MSNPIKFLNLDGAKYIVEKLLTRIKAIETSVTGALDGIIANKTGEEAKTTLTSLFNGINGDTALTELFAGKSDFTELSNKAILNYELGFTSSGDKYPVAQEGNKLFVQVPSAADHKVLGFVRLTIAGTSESDIKGEIVTALTTGNDSLSGLTNATITSVPAKGDNVVAMAVGTSGADAKISWVVDGGAEAAVALTKGEINGILTELDANIYPVDSHPTDANF